MDQQAPVEADEEEDEVLEGQELTNKYLRGELSFSEYARLLASEEDDPAWAEGDMDALDDTQEPQLSAPTAPEGGDDVDGDTRSGRSGDICGDGTTRPRRRRRLLRLRRLPAVLQGMVGEANLRYARGDAAEAEKICKEIIRQAPLAPDPYHTLAMLHEERGDTERSMQYSLIAAHLSPPDRDEWVRLAAMSEAKANYRQAVTCYTKALTVTPGDLSLHMKRIQLAELFSKKVAVIFLKRAVIRVLDGTAADAFRVLKDLNHALLAQNMYQDAREYSGKVFDKFGDQAGWEDTHVYLELLQTTGDHAGCIGALQRFCGVQMIPPLADPAADISALTQVKQFTVPDGVPLDIQYKLLLSLIHLGAIELAAKTLIPSLKGCDPETYGDIYLDVAEALMEQKQYGEALSLLNILVKSQNYGLAGVLLRVAECLHQLGRLQESVEVYRQVIEKAPHHSEARLTLSAILRRLDRPEEAIDVLSQEREQEILDSDLLLEKSALLEKEGRIDEFIETIETLLSQHCPVVRNREEAKSMLMAVKSRESLQRRQFGDPLEETGPLFVDRPTELQRHWSLLRKVLMMLEARGRYTQAANLLLRARGSREFASHAGISRDLDVMCALAHFKARDYDIGFAVTRRLLLADPESTVLWNLLNLVTMQAEDIRHSRFLMRLTHRLPDLISLSLLNGHNCLMAGTYKYALVEYVSAYKLTPDQPMISLLVGVTFIHLAAQKFTGNKHSLVVQAQAFLGLYLRLRGPGQETYYNLGRAMHELGLLPYALHFYQLALQQRPASDGPSMDLRREIGYNLALIYRHSGNMDMARRVTQQYCVI